VIANPLLATVATLVSVTATPLVETVASIFLLTFFLDLLEFALVTRRLRRLLSIPLFWLYYLYHLLIAGLAALAIHGTVNQWLLGPLAAILGVSVLANANIKFGNVSLLEVADKFSVIRAKMIEVAADQESAILRRSVIVAALLKKSVDALIEAHSAGMLGAGWSAEKIDSSQAKARRSSNPRIRLVDELVRFNEAYAQTVI
jgi:hypothetical protein